MDIDIGQAGVLLWHSVKPVDNGAFLAWHSSEHIAGRLQVPGINRVQRYAAIPPSVGYFSWYELANREVLNSPDYVAAASAEPTPQELEVASYFYGVERVVSDVAWLRGGGVGGQAAIYKLYDRIDKAPDRREKLLITVDRLIRRGYVQRASLHHVVEHIYIAEARGGAVPIDILILEGAMDNVALKALCITHIEPELAALTAPVTSSHAFFLLQCVSTTSMKSVRGAS